MGVLLMEQDEEWSIGRKYLDMTQYWEFKAQQQSVSSRKKEVEPNKVA